ncbi:ATP-binding protein, partial [Vibrio cholerae]
YVEKKAEINSNKTIGVLDRTGRLHNYLHALNLKTKAYFDIQSIKNAILTGEINKGIINKDLANKLLYNGDLSHFKITESGINIDTTMVVRKDDVHLKNLIQTLFESFSKDNFNDIKSRYGKVELIFGFNKRKTIMYNLVIVVILLSISLILIRFVQYFRNKSIWHIELIDTIPHIITISNECGSNIFGNLAYRKIYHTCCEKGCVQWQPECLFIALPEQDEAEYSIIIQAPKSNCSIGEHYFHVTRHAISHPINQRKYYLTLFNDITELKETEQALRQSNEQALQAVEARNHFLAVVSHELRTPIAAMLGLMEILASRLKSSESQLLLTNAISSAERLKLHVNDILDFSKIEAQQLQLDIGLYNLADELGPLLRGFETSAQLKEIEFDVIWSPNSLLLAHFDALRFNQIVTNLLSNAIKFTDQGRVVFKIDVAPEMLTIVVEDTGCGMTQTQIDSLFVPFVQADSTITRRFGGTGLGMSIVANLIEVMNGKIEVKSEFEQGTQIKVNLPLVTQTCDEFRGQVVAMSYRSPYMLWAKALGMRVEENEEWVEQSGHNIYPDLLLNRLRDVSNMTQAQAEPAHSRLLQGHVLVADDDAINRLLIKKQLSELGLSATLVSDGLQAFEKLSQHPEQYDLLITDCHMPHLDGFALTRKVKQEISLFKGAVVGCTAEDSRLAAEQALQAGMDKVIYKPYTLANLRKVLSRYLTTQWVVLPEQSWLDAYQEEEREEMALVVAESLAQDIALLNQPNCDVKALAHRIKGAAGSLQLQRLADLAKTVEKQKDPQQLVADKQQLINAMHEVVEQAQQWLHQHQSE